MKEHSYQVAVVWTGNRGAGTESYHLYGRDHLVSVAGKDAIRGSSDPAFLGDSGRWNPEEMLVASLSTCHMLWYLHLCATSGVSVLDYRDAAEGLMVAEKDGAGQFARVVLRPVVTLRAGDDVALASGLHHKAHALCFIARSVNFPVDCEAKIVD